MSIRCIFRTVSTVMIVLTLIIGCGKAEPTVTPVPPANTSVSKATPTNTPVPPRGAPVSEATPASVPPSPLSGGGVIAFTSERDGEGDIYIMNADGSDPQRLTDDPAYDGWPTWSPDGLQIAFVSTRSGNPDIYVMNADGSNLRQLTHHSANDIWPEWSPDGTRMAFPSRRDGNFEIYVMNADGTNIQRLTNTPAAEDFPAWSPDSSQIVFSRTEGNDGTYIVNADGSDERQLMDFEAMEPAWSPDGTRIAFASDHEGFRGIYVIDADGSNLQRLSSTRAGENCPAWSPNGAQIAFASWRDGDGEIYVMDADGDNLQKLTDNRFEEEFPAWRPTATVVSPARASTFSPDDTRTRSTDGMAVVYVPGGTFQMGSTDAEVEAMFSQCEQGLIDRVYCARGFYEYESPQHPVTLGGFWIDRTEVTNAQYTLCVAAGNCSESHLVDNPIYNGDDYPVAGIPWQDAADYCVWAGGRLPTEAEWEYAARGAEARIYPWGNAFDCAGGNFGDDLTGCDDGYAHTAPVGSFPDGVSWCGALDMAGNVWEWVLDKHGDYPAAAQANPTGPTVGELYVLRGGSWGYGQEGVRTAYRYSVPPDATYLGVGFRCVAPLENEQNE